MNELSGISEIDKIGKKLKTVWLRCCVVFNVNQASQYCVVSRTKIFVMNNHEFSGLHTFIEKKPNLPLYIFFQRNNNKKHIIVNIVTMPSSSLFDNGRIRKRKVRRKEGTLPFEEIFFTN